MSLRQGFLLGFCLIGLSIRLDAITCNKKDLMGTMDATSVGLLFEQSEVMKLIPEGYELDENLLIGQKYPVIFLLAFQQNVRISITKNRPWAYDEFLMFVPNVSHAEVGSEKFNFYPRLFLNHLTARVFGMYWGFPKLMANFDVDSNFYSFSRLNIPIVSAELQGDGPYESVDRFPNFSFIAPIFQNRVLQKDRFGRFVRFSINFDIENFVMRDRTVALKIHNSFLPGMPVGSFQVPNISQSVGGAFQYKVDWCITPPERF